MGKGDQKFTVYKFGGASVKDASAVKNVAKILKRNQSKPLVVVISAMGKTTNALEEIVALAKNEKDITPALQKIVDYHLAIITILFKPNHLIFQTFERLINQLTISSAKLSKNEYDFFYDQIVSFGEIISTTIISEYLNEVGIKNNYLDARDHIITDDSYREAKVNWKKSKELISKISDKKGLYITQGFIGKSSRKKTTTLGREGSDFTAAIFAYCLNAKEVMIWKDVPGMLNADPKWFDKPSILKNISYYEAVELAYYGATVIHPKTIKPLQNKNIPLYVKSFLKPGLKGTLINNNTSKDSLIPSFIFKVNQILISISAKDYSFIVEDNLSDIFKLFANLNVKINLMQNSAISFSVCCDNDKTKITPLLHKLAWHYKILYNTDVELVTVRHFDAKTISRVTKNKTILLQQKSRTTARMVMKDKV